MSFPYKVVRHEKSHESAEDYLENILILRERNGNVYKVVRHEKSHESAEDYLENILILRERNGNVRSMQYCSGPAENES